MHSSLCATIAAAFSCRRRNEAFPGLLAEAPCGEVVVKVQSSPDARAAIARDLGRFWRVVSVLGRDERRPLAAGASASSGAEDLFGAIGGELRAEFTAQGWGLDRSGRTKSGKGDVDARVLEHLAELVATHLTVGPGIDVAVRTQLLPRLALHEPTFLIAVGAGQVRVVTFVRVGGQGAGNESYWQQPPVVVKLATCDLVPVAVKAANSAEAAQSQGNETTSVMPVAFVAERVVRGTRSMALHVKGYEQRLLASAARGDWSNRASAASPRGPPAERFRDEDEEESLSEPLLARQ